MHTRILGASLLTMLAGCLYAAEITGTLADKDGQPVPNRLMHFYHGPKNQLLSVTTDAAGRFATGEGLSEECGLIVAEVGDGGPLSRVTFLAKDIGLGKDEKRQLDLRLSEHRPAQDNEDAVRLLHCDWPEQTISRHVILDEPVRRPKYPKTWRGAAVQISDVERDENSRVKSYRAHCRLGVEASGGELSWLVRKGIKRPFAKKRGSRLEIGNEKLALALPRGKDPMAAPILAVRGVDGQWFGRGAWKDVEWQSCELEELDRGDVFARYRITYAKESGERYVITITLNARDDFFRVEERTSPGLQGRWELDLSEGYTPDRHRQYRYYQAFAPAELPKEPTVLASIQPWTFCGIMDFRETVAVYQNEGRNDAVALFSVDGAEWTTENGKHFYEFANFSSRDGWRMPADTTATRLLCDGAGKLMIRYPLQSGTRITGWAVYDKRYDETRYKAEDARHILSDTPLSDMLAMKLAWDKPTAAPALHGTAEQWKALLPAEKTDKTGWGYLNGRRDLIPQLRTKVLGLCRSLVGYYSYPPAFEKEKPRTSLKGYIGTGQRAIEVGPLERQLAEEADFAFALGALSGDEQSYVRAAMAFLAYKASDPDLYASMNALGNFKVDGYFGLMLLSGMLRDHPDFSSFWHHYLRQVKQDVEQGVYLYEDGGTNECPIYVLMAMNFLVKQAWYLRTWGFEYDLASKPRFRRALEMMAEWTTPPIPKLNDATARVLPLIGDTTTHGRDQWGLFGTAAKLYEKTDPQFAGQMLWWWNLMGKTQFWGHGINCTMGVNQLCTVPKGGRLARSLRHSKLEPTPPAPYGSRKIKGVGVLFRKDWNTPNEFMFLMKAGRSSGHDHPDDGAFVLSAGGKCLSTGYGKYPYMTSSWRYNLVRFDGRSNWSRGKVTGFLSSDVCDAVTAHIPVVNVSKNREMLLREQWDKRKQFFEETWAEVHDVEPSWYDRDVVFHRLDQYLVIYDVTGPHYNTDWFAHVMSDDYAVKGATVSLPGREGVGVDIHIVKPAGAEPTVIPVFEKLFAKELAAGKGPKPRLSGIKQTTIQLQQPPDSEYLAVWHPRKAKATNPIEIATGKVMRITSLSGTSLFVCEREPGQFREGDFALDGSRGYLVNAGNAKCLGLLKGRQLSLGKYVFSTDADARLQATFVNGKLTSLQVSALAKARVTVASPVSVALRSKEAGVSASGRELALELPAGETTLVCD